LSQPTGGFRESRIGGGREFPFGHVKFTIAHHGSTGPEGEPLGNPMDAALLAPKVAIPMHYDTFAERPAFSSGIRLDLPLPSP